MRKGDTTNIPLTIMMFRENTPILPCFDDIGCSLIKQHPEYEKIRTKRKLGLVDYDEDK